MPTPNTNSPEILSGEILAQAGRECEEILRRAEQESESILAAAKAEAGKIRSEKLEAARVEAARRSELILATVPVEAGRMRAERREVVLENIREEAHRQLSAGNFNSHETVVVLVTAAINQIPGTDFVLKLSAADYTAFGNKLSGELCQRIGRSPLNLAVSADSVVTGGGVIVQSADGLRLWDNRLESRLERLWPELRRQIALNVGLVEKNASTGGAA